jgi:ribonucleoside-diphosphate reductase alpha chain
MVSLAAKNGCTIHEIIDQLKSCGVCPSYATRYATKKDTSRGSCCPVAVGNALLEMWKEMQDELGNDGTGKERMAKEIHSNASKVVNKEIKDAGGDKTERCQICGSKIEHVGGCDQCNNCGWSKCE